MKDPWDSLRSTVDLAIGPIWNGFAKEGRESAVFAPMAIYPGASAWVAESMSLSTNYIARKLGAMLAGWIVDARYTGLLSTMLDREREVFRGDSLTGNSVGEDIMFAATRWAGCADEKVSAAGFQTLARMIWDSLDGVHWNTVHWAAANLFRTTEGKHPIFAELLRATDTQLKGQRFLQHFLQALRQNDLPELAESAADPSLLVSLCLDDPNYLVVHSLWEAAAIAEAAL